MKTQSIKLMFMATALFSVGLIASCSDDDDKVVPADDKTGLTDKITEAEDLISTTEEGTLEGQFQAGAQATLQTSIDAAQEVAENDRATQAQVNSATTNLQSAIDDYMGKQVAPIDEANLVGRWKFDEGTGTTAHDDSDNGFDGTFKNGPEGWGAGFPVWAEDRYGNEGQAIHFNEGANIEVPYNAALNPGKLSISLWLKADEINANNRFLGLQSWIAYKFQLQEANRPFLTVATDESTFDRDSEEDLPIGSWHHVVATFGDGNTIFYVDGEFVKEWNDTPGTAKSISSEPYNLVFGQDFPTDKYASTTTNFDNDHIIPLEWGGYFRGSLDEIRIYKSALTSGQVASIYNAEKP